jgi:hypothetical protein
MRGALLLLLLPYRDHGHHQDAAEARCGVGDEPAARPAV